MSTADAGWVLRIKRAREEIRAGKGFARTISEYAVFHNGAPSVGLAGQFVERQGPGDNTASGVKSHRRIEAGTYELWTHDGASNEKYKTIGYSISDGVDKLPRPSLRLEPAGKRSGILIHPAAGYLWSIGCLNPTGGLNDANDNIKWKDSRSRVIALIEDLKSYLASEFPTKNNVRIPRASCVITGEP